MDGVVLNMVSLRHAGALPGEPLAAQVVFGGMPVWMVPDRGTSRSRTALAGKSILVVEDEFLLADEVAEWLSDRGAIPLGPVGTLPGALELIRQTPPDAAVLDVRIAGDIVFPAALELHRRGIPLIFATAFAGEANYPAELAGKIRLDKPFNEAQLIAALERALDGAV